VADLPKDEELSQLPGRGKLDFAPLIAALAKINYTGFTEVFMHPTPRGIPICATTAEVTAEVVRAREYLESLVPA
jgi:sugar phosphate isomerase/epimerase